MTAGIWTESIPVRSSDLTPHATASVPALCTDLQEAAGHHADELGVSMRRLRTEDRAWVLSHLHLDLDDRPGGNTTITIETWPSGLDGLYATREFVLSVDDAEFGRATSRWFVLDTERRRPVRPPRTLYEIETPDRPPVLPHDFDDLPTPARIDHEHAVTAHYYDLDLNRHVNSIRSLEWMLGTLPHRLHETHRCTQLALQFVGEAQAGDAIRSVAQLDSDDVPLSARHALRHAENGDRLVVATTAWTPRP